MLYLGFVEVVRVAYVAVPYWTEHVLSLFPILGLRWNRRKYPLSLSPSSLSRDLLSRLLRRLCQLSLVSSCLSVRRRSRSVVALAPSSQWMTRAVFSVDVGPSSPSPLSVRRLSRCMRRLSPFVFSLDPECKFLPLFIKILFRSLGGTRNMWRWLEKGLLETKALWIVTWKLPWKMTRTLPTVCFRQGRKRLPKNWIWSACLNLWALEVKNVWTNRANLRSWIKVLLRLKNMQQMVCFVPTRKIIQI